MILFLFKHQKNETSIKLSLSLVRKKSYCKILFHRFFDITERIQVLKLLRRCVVFSLPLSSFFINLVFSTSLSWPNSSCLSILIPLKRVCLLTPKKTKTMNPSVNYSRFCKKTHIPKYSLIPKLFF
jgi:hypothetical protein